MNKDQLCEQRRGRLKRIARKNWPLWAFLAPGICATFVFGYMPIYGVLIAFKDFKMKLGIMASPWAGNFGFEHFLRFLNHPDFLMICRNSIMISLYEMLLFPLPVILALFLNELHSNRFKKTVQMVSYAPYFLSDVIIVGILQLLLAYQGGSVNDALELILGHRVHILDSASAFIHMYVWSGVWRSIGYGSIIYIAALSGVSPELEEAARIDGAGRFRIMWHVKIPAILPTIIILFIMGVGGILNGGSIMNLLLQNPINRPASEVFATYIYNYGVRQFQYSYTTAIGFFQQAVGIVLTLIINKISGKVSGVALW